ncbi:MAG: protein-L-isoaspartate(D-aspartate) O-methyltransferase [Anaerolineales bacterium]|jgi:protein-L-isoaspartate(D-aspartate) O-methyltransferase
MIVERWLASACLVTLSAACGSSPDIQAFTTASAPPAIRKVSPTAEDPFAKAREHLITDGVAAMGVESQVVLDAMRRVPRHLFVPEEHLKRAYNNIPLPIGYGQTISQPYIVGLMSEALNVEAGDRVLEIGTGSGYQAAVLAEMGIDVYTMEIIEPLADMSAQRLANLGYDSVQVRIGDGYYGWPDFAPFDAIIVTAAPDHVPQPLLEQLKIGGVLVIPVGPVGGFQELWQIERVSETEFESASLGGVQFVPLTGEH